MLLGVTFPLLVVLTLVCPATIWQSNFEMATRIPFVIRAPGQTVRGATVDTIIEAVDLYPTLAALAGQSVPRAGFAGPCVLTRAAAESVIYLFFAFGFWFASLFLFCLIIVDASTMRDHNTGIKGLGAPEDVDGVDRSSLVLQNNTDTAMADDTDKIAFSEYPRCAAATEPWEDSGSCVYSEKDTFVIIGYSMRNASWRCTLWMTWLPQRYEEHHDERLPVCLQ